MDIFSDADSVGSAGSGSRHPTGKKRTPLSLLKGVNGGHPYLLFPILARRGLNSAREPGASGPSRWTRPGRPHRDKSIDRHHGHRRGWRAPREGGDGGQRRRRWGKRSDRDEDGDNAAYAEALERPADPPAPAPDSPSRVARPRAAEAHGHAVPSPTQEQRRHSPILPSEPRGGMFRLPRRHGGTRQHHHHHHHTLPPDPLPPPSSRTLPPPVVASAGDEREDVFQDAIPALPDDDLQGRWSGSVASVHTASSDRSIEPPALNAPPHVPHRRSSLIVEYNATRPTDGAFFSPKLESARPSLPPPDSSQIRLTPPPPSSDSVVNDKDAPPPWAVSALQHEKQRSVMGADERRQRLEDGSSEWGVWVGGELARLDEANQRLTSRVEELTDQVRGLHVSMQELLESFDDVKRSTADQHAFLLKKLAITDHALLNLQRRGAAPPSGTNEWFWLVISYLVQATLSLLSPLRASTTIIARICCRCKRRQSKTEGDGGIMMTASTTPSPLLPPSLLQLRLPFPAFPKKARMAPQPLPHAAAAANNNGGMSSRSSANDLPAVGRQTPTREANIRPPSAPSVEAAVTVQLQPPSSFANRSGGPLSSVSTSQGERAGGGQFASVLSGLRATVNVKSRQHGQSGGFHPLVESTVKKKKVAQSERLVRDRHRQ
ncbi:unnamed protein product [Vitrella brassicaformis CCMP3155]|uniref:Uncharacterized protein n=2 Tax=Vitrella brassicaformis TaxID=1169539 RepID=A0A0G4ERS8_VITBC|nr:unnamed protein product [Vitrella brassicaformis CCMP3155]|eukprot:CEM00754.1 unnamed protein product [Vitrella brassicaformis CCMP3155]